MMATTSTQVVGLRHSFADRFGGQLDVLRDISLTVSNGECIAILGPSGCGKSTLLRCIAGLIGATAGRVMIDGQQSSNARRAKAIGFVFQEPALLEWRTVRANISLPLELGQPKASPAAKQQRVDALLTLVGLQPFAEYLPAQLSGGMKQRVALARALVAEPRLLLLDEPFGALDMLTRERLGVELAKLLSERNIPTVLVTHSIEEAVFLGTRVVLLSSRPAQILEMIDVPFPRPRTLELLGQSAFHWLVQRCRKALSDAAPRYEPPEP